MKLFGCTVVALADEVLCAQVMVRVPAVEPVVTTPFTWHQSEPAPVLEL